MTIVQLYDLFAVRHRRTFLAVFVVALAAAVIVTLTLPREYRAEATLVVGENRPLAAGTSPMQDEVLTRTYASLLETSAVERDVLVDLPFELERSELADKVSFEVLPATRLIRISTLDEDPRRAEQLADAYATTFVRRQQRLAVEARREQLDAQLERIGDLTAELDGLEGATQPPAVERRARLAAELEAVRETYRSTQQDSVLQGANVSIASGATLPTTPARPRTRLNLAVGFVFALLLAAAAVLLRNVFDDSVHGEDDVAEMLGSPTSAARAARAAPRRRRPRTCCGRCSA